MEKFSDISNRNELARFLKIPLKNLTHILYVEKPDTLYTVFDIPKRKEGTRRICAPCEKLKNIPTTDPISNNIKAVIYIILEGSTNSTRLENITPPIDSYK